MPKITEESQYTLEQEFKHELARLGSHLSKNPSVQYEDTLLISNLNRKFIELCDNFRLLMTDNKKENVEL